MLDFFSFFLCDNNFKRLIFPNLWCIIYLSGKIVTFVVKCLSERKEGNSMMLGEFKSTLDPKGRMNFPVKLRDELGSSFVISKTIDKQCIKVYSKTDWEALVKSIREMPQVKTAGIQRFLFGSAFEIEPDKQGRALIPAPLREYAQLKTDIVIVGLEGRAEIWDKESWDKFNSSLDMNELLAAAVEMGL